MFSDLLWVFFFFFLSFHSTYYKEVSRNPSQILPLPVFNSQDPVPFMEMSMPFYVRCIPNHNIIIRFMRTLCGDFFSDCPRYIIFRTNIIRLNLKAWNIMLPQPQYNILYENLEIWEGETASIPNLLFEANRQSNVHI